MSEPFPPQLVLQAFNRSGARCECVRHGHGHPGRCNAPLSFSLQGAAEPGGWHASAVDSEGPAIVSNCEVVCTACFLRRPANGL
ncbi:MAG: hypothetical protein QHH05_04050 [Syntrophomonadaceae bacterium]|jgi:hypothetical protein|nr:hypothetical protein [Syntrophomonadaceae bacterium]MDH7497600.1 hypothetical protein [Syntrophomonadaceae bacterium]